MIAEKTKGVNKLKANNLVYNQKIAPAIAEFSGYTQVASVLSSKVENFSYLEHIARLKSESGIYSCGRFAAIGKCSDNENHIIGRILRCGREWCPVCGENRSEAHRRRYGRLIPKVQQMSSMGMVTITWPIEARKKLRSKSALRDIARVAKKVMRDNGYVRGIHRWHWFGDRSTVFHPHLMFLVDGGKLSKERLAEIKENLREATGAGVIHYTFAAEPKKIVHMLRYVTRATFKNIRWDIEFVEIIKGFINIGYWGIKNTKSKGYWNNPAVWSFDNLSSDDCKELEELKKVFNNECPCCSGQIIWKKEIFDSRRSPPGSYKMVGENYVLLASGMN